MGGLLTEHAEAPGPPFMHPPSAPISSAWDVVGSESALASNAMARQRRVNREVIEVPVGEQRLRECDGGAHAGLLFEFVLHRGAHERIQSRRLWGARDEPVVDEH